MAKLGIIGVGNMGGAIVGGLLSEGWSKKDLELCEKDEARRQKIKEQFGCTTVSDPAELSSKAVLLSTKPNDAIAALKALGSSTDEVISIVAGLQIKSIRAAHSASTVVRAMPNMPAQIHLGATALSGDRSRLAEEIFEAVGIFVWVDEQLIDPVTAVSGSGPAYLFALASEMIDSAASLGIPIQTATALVVQTLKGSAELLSANPDPAALRKAVTSPGGTTHAAFEVWADRKISESLRVMIEAATQRATELGTS